MKKHLLFLAAGFLLLVSCKKEINNTTTEVVPSNPAGILEGMVVLYDEFGNQLSNYSGAIVTLDSTSYTTTTDSTGKYILKNVPTNTYYNFTFSKAGYGSYHYPNYLFALTGGNAPVQTNISNNNTNSNYYTNSTPRVGLYQISTSVIQAFTVAVSNSDTSSLNITATVKNSNPAYTASDAIGVVVFVSSQKNVSSTNYEYTVPATLYNYGTNQVGVFAGSGAAINAVGTYTFLASGSTYSFTPSSSPYNYPVGTTLYFIAYGCSGNYQFNYLNIATGLTVFPSINSTASAIVSAVTK